MKCKWCVSERFISNNDKLVRFAKGLYIQQKEGERELDRGETDRERERVRERKSFAIREK